ncbi:MAG: energy transducer TonB [Sneathiella sp.]|nr:energy transducer TonB [Sneathiella sp.]
MKNYYSISIPKPCHEDWNTMTPKEKGRFCNSCSKTVIDFTKMDVDAIQEFIHNNQHKKICGHFKQKQLDSINLRIPFQVIQSQQNIYKTFLFSLLIVMGSTLFSCTNNDGKPQKIDSIEVIDSTNNKVVDFLGVIDNDAKIDSIVNLNIPPPPIILGEVVTVDGDMRVEINSNRVLNYLEVEVTPEFENTPQHLSTEEKRDYFKTQISEFILNNFNIETTINLGLKGKQRINAQFTIDSLGFVKDIRVRSPHKWLEKEAMRILSLLPRLIPAKHNGKPVEMLYSLPIIFQEEE